jgi:hypothetical protein
MSAPTFDIFQQFSDGGGPLWVGVASSLEDAKKKIAELAALKPGNYAVYDSAQGVFVMQFPSAND